MFGSVSASAPVGGGISTSTQDSSEPEIAGRAGNLPLSRLDRHEVESWLEAIGRSDGQVVFSLFPAQQGPCLHRSYDRSSIGWEEIGGLLERNHGHALGLVVNPPKPKPEDWGTRREHKHRSGNLRTWGASAAHISHAVGLWVEDDSGLPLERQEQLPATAGLPAPTLTVFTGGKSLHQYWLLGPGEALTVEQFKTLQKRLAAKLAAVGQCEIDASLSDPCQVMRVPGGLHPATGRWSRVHGGSGERFTVADLERMLPPETPAEPPEAHRSQPPPDLPPRPQEALLEALQRVPQFQHGQGQRNQLLGLALRLWVEVGADEAQRLLQQTCASGIDDLERYFTTEPTGISHGSVWPYLRDQWRIDIRRHDLRRQQRPQDAEQRQRERPGPDQQQRQRDQPERTFESDWAEVEAYADEVMAQPWPRMKQQAAIARKAAGLGISLAAAQREHLLEDALRRQRPTDQPVGPGGIFTVTPSSFAVDGVFRHGLNLLVGAAGVQKTRLSLDAIAAWLRGAAQWLDRDMPAPDTDQERHALIIGTDQGLDDWAECLLPLGLATRQGDQVTLSRQLTLYPAATGTRLDADGLTLIRHWCDAHPGGVVLVDSLAAVLPPGIDLDKPAVGGPIRALGDALGRCWGILTHHARKAAGKDQNLGVGAASGSNQIDAAVARVVGLGLLHRMEAGQRVPMEGDHRRELFSTKRGGPPLHLIISGDSHGRFTNHGSAEALKQQERQERARQNLTDGRMAALDALEGTDGWMTVRDVVLAIGEVSADQFSTTSGAAAAARRDLGALVRAGLAQQQRAGREKTYRASEHLNTREVEKECSDCSGLSGTGVSGVQISVQQCSGPPPEHLNTCPPGPAASEHLPEVLNGPEHRTEHPRPVAPTHLNNLNTCPPRTVAKGCSDGCSDPPDLLEPLLPVVISGPIGSAGLDQIDDGDDPAWGPRPSDLLEDAWPDPWLSGPFPASA